MGIDPVTHKPKNEALSAGDGQSNKNAANLSHMAQWESARLEAEARLVRESKLRSRSLQLSSATTTSSTGMPFDPLVPTSSRATWYAGGCDLESPTSTLTLSENQGTAPPSAVVSSEIDIGTIPQMIEFVGSSGSAEADLLKDEAEGEWKEMDNSVGHFVEYKQFMENSVSFGSNLNDDGPLSMDGFTSLLLNDSIDDLSLSDSGKESENSGGVSDYHEDNKNYWNNILNLVNSSPSDSSMF